MFPADNAWNQDVSAARRCTPAAPRSSPRSRPTALDNLHPDFGENPDYGIPYVVVPANQPLVPITYTAYGDESDPGPFPIPLDAPVEGGGAGGDRHVLVLPPGHVRAVRAVRRRSAAVPAGTPRRGARFDLTSNALRPLGWTSADAAGLPILPGLVRYDEVAAGVIRHAIRVTFSETQRGYILPATHFASSTRPIPNRAADGPAAAAEGVVRHVAAHRSGAGDRGGDAAYGLIVADNGSNWFFQGAPSPGWDDDDLNQLKDDPRHRRSRSSTPDRSIT